MASGTVTCLCGATNFPLSKDDPNTTELCHCNPCRHTTGALFGGWIGPLSSAPPGDVISRCTIYKSSNTHDRLFCSTCGTKTFIHPHYRTDDGTEKDYWVVFGGAVDPPDGAENVLDIESNEWICDAADGGMAPFFAQMGGRDVPCYNVDRKSERLDTIALNGLIKNADSPLPIPEGETLKAECRCGGVSLRLERAKPEDTEVSKLDRFIPKDADGRPTGRHMAFCCVCRYCRLQSGVSLTPWVYIPPIQVVNPHTNQPVAQHHEAGTDSGREANKGLSLKHYWSSADACRSFCSTCGASVFYSCDSRQDIVNVAAGLLRAEEGPMARRWLSWQWGRTAWWKDGTTQKDVMEAWQGTADMEEVA